MHNVRRSILVLTLSFLIPLAEGAEPSQMPLEIEGECVRELMHTNLLRMRSGAKVSPDALRSVTRFQLVVDGCRWLMRQRHAVDGYEAETLHFSDGTDFFSLAGPSTNAAASISPGPVPAGGTGEMQALWYALCRPSCPELDWQRLPNVPNLVALQDRTQRTCDQVIITTNAMGRIDKAEMFVDVGGKPMLLDEFTFRQHPDASLAIPVEAVRRVHAVDVRKGTNVASMRFTITVSGVRRIPGRLELPALGSWTQVADYRLVPSQGDGWFVDYGTTNWLGREELLADPEIAARMSQITNDMRNHDRLREANETRSLLGRALFIVCFVALIFGMLVIVVKQRRARHAEHNKTATNKQ